MISVNQWNPFLHTLSTYISTMNWALSLNVVLIWGHKCNDNDYSGWSRVRSLTAPSVISHHADSIVQKLRALEPVLVLCFADGHICPAKQSGHMHNMVSNTQHVLELIRIERTRSWARATREHWTISVDHVNIHGRFPRTYRELCRGRAFCLIQHPKALAPCPCIED